MTSRWDSWTLATPLFGIFWSSLNNSTQDSPPWKADSCSASKDKPLASTQQTSTQTPRGPLTVTVPLATSLRTFCTYRNALLVLGTRHFTIKYTVWHIALGCWASCVWRGVGGLLWPPQCDAELLLTCVLFNDTDRRLCYMMLVLNE